MIPLGFAEMVEFPPKEKLFPSLCQGAVWFSPRCLTELYAAWTWREREFGERAPPIGL